MTLEALTANAESQIRAVQNARRIAQITAEALVANARAKLDQLKTPLRTPIDAYVRTLPSAGSMASSIGTIRIPVDGYIRHVPSADMSRLVGNGPR